MRTHPLITALLFLLTGGLSAIVAIAGPLLLPAAIAELAAPATDDARIAAALADVTGRAITIAAGVLVVPCLVCGVAILRRKGWSRWIGIPIAAVALVFFPVGTAVGAYVLWVLLARRFEPWFEAELSPRAARGAASGTSARPRP